VCYTRCPAKTRAFTCEHVLTCRTCNNVPLYRCTVCRAERSDGQTEPEPEVDEEAEREQAELLDSDSSGCESEPHSDHSSQASVRAMIVHTGHASDVDSESHCSEVEAAWNQDGSEDEPYEVRVVENSSSSSSEDEDDSQSSDGGSSNDESDHGGLIPFEEIPHRQRRRRQEPEHFEPEWSEGEIAVDDDAHMDLTSDLDDTDSSESCNVVFPIELMPGFVPA
jgi:hypothetical protein